MTVDEIAAAVTASYDDAEFPALLAMIRDPHLDLTGLRVLCAFPVFANTLALYWALSANGADVSVSVSPHLPADPTVVARLPEFGIDVVDPTALQMDVVMDCAGLHRAVTSRFGYVELTMSGADAYRDCDQPVFLVDAGRIKHIENALGTGDGFLRGMAYFGYRDLSGRTVVVVGGGKVGSGIAQRCAAEGAVVTVIDRHTTDVGHHRINASDEEAVRAAFASAWCVVTATGQNSALGSYATDLVAGGAILANMGAFDEYGPDVPTERVLNGKAPLNFALPEPTLLRYIDPSLALSAAGVAELVGGRLATGLNTPDPALEERILSPARATGAVASELVIAGL